MTKLAGKIAFITGGGGIGVVVVCVEKGMLFPGLTRSRMSLRDIKSG